MICFSYGRMDEGGKAAAVKVIDLIWFLDKPVLDCGEQLCLGKSVPSNNTDCRGTELVALMFEDFLGDAGPA